MKILMISEFFPPIMGGLERHVDELSRALAGKGHKVKVLTLGWKGLNKHEKQDGFEIQRISGIFQPFGFIYGDQNRRFHPPMPDPILMRKIIRVIKEFRPDIIHCHGWIVYSALQSKKFFNIPLVVTLHDYGLICPTRTMLKDGAICWQPFTSDCITCAKDSLGFYKSKAAYWAMRANRRKLKMVDKFIAVSSFVKEIYQRHLKLDESTITVIPNFYSPTLRSEQLVTNINLPEDFILFVGTFSFSKGVNVLIEAYKRIKTNAKMVLIGFKHQDFYIEPSENIIILENQPHHVVMEAWRRCRFGVVPSVWPEPCPTVALEAMACGKAVVASDIGGLKDIVVHGKTGLLVPPGDAEAVARALDRLVDEPELAEEMGEKGRERLEEYFSLALVVEKIEDLYRKAKDGVAF
jgi:glycosyltransferase involved in cell wall biosynthesis